MKTAGKTFTGFRSSAFPEQLLSPAHGATIQQRPCCRSSSFAGLLSPSTAQTSVPGCSPGRTWLSHVWSAMCVIPGDFHTLQEIFQHSTGHKPFLERCSNYHHPLNNQRGVISYLDCKIRSFLQFVSFREKQPDYPEYQNSFQDKMVSRSLRMSQTQKK